MEIIAKTGEGVLITATDIEVREILSSVTGGNPTDIEVSIGGKIPAIDYAGTIKKLKALPASYEFKNLMDYARRVNGALADLEEAVNKATNL